MEIVILIGGKGSRIKKISKSTPKPFLKIRNKQIIEHQIEQLIRLKKKIILLTNSKYSKFHKILIKKNSHINFKVIEESKPLGTGGCLKSLENFNAKYYLIVFGDLIFDIDIKKFFLFHKKKESDLTLIVHPNDHPFDSDLLEINEKCQLIKFHNKPHKRNDIGNLSLSGIFLINRNILNYVKSNTFQDFSKDIIPKLMKKNKKIFAYNTREFVKDVGTPKRIKLVKKQMNTRKFLNGNINKKLPAVFLDRDGVINKEILGNHYQNPLKLISGSVSAIKKINSKGYLAVVVTNQASVAKGFITISQLEKDHNKLQYFLGSKGAYLDRIYYCPYHPEKGFKGEIRKFKKKSKMRKPDNGMFLKAIKELNIDVKKSFMIGNSLVDFQAAKKTKVKFLLVGNKFKLPKIKNYRNMLNAVNTIL